MTCRPTMSEGLDFIAYLRQCSDAQVRGVYEKERDAERAPFALLARMEADKRGVELDD